MAGGGQEQASRTVGFLEGYLGRRSSLYQNESPWRIEPIVHTITDAANNAVEPHKPKPPDRIQMSTATARPSSAPQAPRTTVVPRSGCGSG
jgi:hypothetical protein